MVPTTEKKGKSTSDRVTAKLFFSLCLCAPLVACAAPITWGFSGVVILATGIWSGQGTAVTGSFTYESRLVEVDPHLSDPSQDLFEADAPANRNR